VIFFVSSGGLSWNIYLIRGYVLDRLCDDRGFCDGFLKRILRTTTITIFKTVIHYIICIFGTAYKFVYFLVLSFLSNTFIVRVLMHAMLFFDDLGSSAQEIPKSIPDI